MTAWKRWTAWILSLFLLLPMAAHADTGEFIGFAVVQKNEVRLRKEPNGERIRFLAKGETVYVAGKETDQKGETWYRVYADKGQLTFSLHGYVHEDMLQLFPEIMTDVVEFDASFHVLAVLADGTVKAIGAATSGPAGAYYDVGDWRDVVEVKASTAKSFGLTASGEVLACGHNAGLLHGVQGIRGFSTGDREYAIDARGRLHAEFSFFEWYFPSDTMDGLPPLAQVSARTWGFAAIAKDGGVIRFGFNPYGECDIDERWAGIAQIEIGEFHTVGLKPDGTVIAIGDNTFGQCDVEEWTDIRSIAANSYTTYGLRNDGTVVMAGYDNERASCNVDEWENIVKVKGGSFFIIGLTQQGTLVMAGEPTRDYTSGERDERMLRLEARAYGDYSGNPGLLDDARYTKAYRPEDIVR